MRARLFRLACVVASLATLAALFSADQKWIVLP
jgi:hypothetical protein